jgi:hypothetical protein
MGGIPRAGPSRVPRVSTYGAGAGGSGYRPFAMGGGGKRMSFAPMGMGADEKTNSLTMGMTDKEIDERVGFRLFSRCSSYDANCSSVHVDRKSCGDRSGQTT